MASSAGLLENLVGVRAKVSSTPACFAGGADLRAEEKVVDGGENHAEDHTARYSAESNVDPHRLRELSA